jgi:hypothetical protein
MGPGDKPQDDTCGDDLGRVIHLKKVIPALSDGIILV